MLGEQILSYLNLDTTPVSSSQSNNSDFLELIESLQCGESRISILPSLIYLIGIALLVHHIITMNIRPQLYRRVGRELLLQIPWQEILILMLIYQCIRIWLSTLSLVNSLFKYYQNQLTAVCPSGIKIYDGINSGPCKLSITYKIFRDFLKLPLVVCYITSGFAPFSKWINATDISNLHPIIQTMLLPKLMKIILCTCMSLTPLLALIKLKERRPLPQLMLWMGPARRDRSELGASSYYLERPISESVTPNSSDSDTKRSNSCCDVNELRPIRPKRPRARKSVSV